MSDRPSDMKEPDGGQQPDRGEDGLRMAEAPPLPVTRSDDDERRRWADVEASAVDTSHGSRGRRARVDDEGSGISWGPIVFALVIVLGLGAGLWRWRTVEAKRKAAAAAVIESPLEYHKRQFLAALRGDGTNAVPMQVRADRMRFHQRALLSRGFLAERKFVFTNGAAKASVAVNRIEGVSMEFAMVEPRGKDVLAVIAPADDMPAWESLMRLSGAK